MAKGDGEALCSYGQRSGPDGRLATSRLVLIRLCEASVPSCTGMASFASDGRRLSRNWPLARRGTGVCCLATVCH